MSSLIVVLDACVLLPQTPRDTLLRAKEENLYTFYWTKHILEEVRRNLITKWEMQPDKAQNLINTFCSYFPQAMIGQYEHLIDTMPNNVGDRHVLAAAVACKADVIVTENVRHFPEEQLAPLHITAQSLDTFLTYLYDRAPTIMKKIIREQAGALRNPAMTVAEIENRLAVTAPDFIRSLRNT